jgi:hypothetical protein
MLAEKLSLGTIQQMNTAAALFCAGNILGAKEQLEDLLERLDMKVIASSGDSRGILPSYLVNILVYLLLKTSKCFIQMSNPFLAENLKVARSLVKHRRFLQEEGESARELNTAVKMFT